MALLHILWDLWTSFNLWGKWAVLFFLVCGLAAVVPVLKNSDRPNEEPPPKKDP